MEKTLYTTSAYPVVFLSKGIGRCGWDSNPHTCAGTVFQTVEVTNPQPQLLPSFVSLSGQGLNVLLQSNSVFFSSFRP